MRYNIADYVDLDIPFSPIAATFTMDKDSVIKGKNVSITLTPKRDNKLIEINTQAIINDAKALDKLDDGGYSETLTGTSEEAFQTAVADIVEGIVGNLIDEPTGNEYTAGQILSGVLKYTINEILEDAKTYADGEIEKFNEYLDGKLKNLVSEIEKKIHGKIAFEDISATINIGGTIEASENINIASNVAATAHDTENEGEIKNEGKGLGWAFSYLNADSKINITETAKMTAGQDVSITSTVTTTNKITQEEKDATEGALSNLDIALAVGIVHSSNEINIANRTDEPIIEAGDDISIKALTERTSKLSIKGGSVDSYVGLSAGVLVENATTKIDIAGWLTANNSNATDGTDTKDKDGKPAPEIDGINILAKTDTKTNSIFVEAEMRNNKKENADAEKNKAAEGITASLTKVADKKGINGASGGEDTPKIGAAGAVAVTVDNVATEVVLASTAKITSDGSGDVNIAAETVNQIASGAFALIEEANNENPNTLLAVSVPLVFMNNKTNVISGADITAGGNIVLTAETKIPLNEKLSDNVLYKLVNDVLNESDYQGGIDDVKKIIDDFKTGDKGHYFGLADGLLNTWGQSSSKTDNFGGAAMVTYLDVTNTTVAQITGGTITAKNLNVEAKTSVELANLVGSFASAVGEEVPKDGFPDVANKTGNHPQGVENRAEYERIYMAGDGSSAGGALLITNIDTTTIARIDGGTIDITDGDITVKAETQVVDIGIAIGGGSDSGTFALNLMANPSFYDSYTLAKIDDVVQVNTQNVSIFADDAAYRIGVAGSLTRSSHVSVGISGASSVLWRDAHAVWGNLLNVDGTLARIKGDTEREQEYADTVESVVTGNVTVKSNLHGINIVASVAGGETHDDLKDIANQEERNKKIAEKYAGLQSKIAGWFVAIDGTNARNLAYTENPQNNNLSNKHEQFWDINKGINDLQGVKADTGKESGAAGAIVFSYIAENSSAGISGNANITADKISVNALNSVYDVSVGGGVFAQTGQSEGGASIAGGVAINILEGNTLAYIQPKTKSDTNLITYGELNINAERTGSVIAVALGGAGSSSANIAPEVKNEPRQVNLVKLQKLTALCIFQYKAKIGNLGKHRLRGPIFSSGAIIDLFHNLSRLVFSALSMAQTSFVRNKCLCRRLR